MPWNDLPDFEHDLQVALTKLDWTKVDELSTTLCDRLAKEADPFPEEAARRLFRNLRKKRRFVNMGQLADAMLQAGLTTAQMRRQYGQALIDQGMLTAAEQVLQALANDPQTNANELAEARGLLGRVYKQLYVNAGGKGLPERNAANLEKAITQYGSVYDQNKTKFIWQGINTVALAERAAADGITLKNPIDAQARALEILETIRKIEEEAENGLDIWSLATRMEALIALKRYDEADAACRLYADDPTADAFEIASTERQLKEVWRLNECTAPGESILPRLRAALAYRVGGCVVIDPATVRKDLQKTFGVDGSQSYLWWIAGLRCAQSVCRIENEYRQGLGTGWLVDSLDFFPDKPSRQLVLTNFHVVPTAIQAGECWANFQIREERPKVVAVHWDSEIADLDATFLELEATVNSNPIPIGWDAVQMADPAPRLYIIGHPGGGDLKFSFQDNHLLACNDKRLHYRTPTEPGSSGSPVFGSTTWKAIGLHHAGDGKMQKLDGPPGETYQANEGITILAIKAGTTKPKV